MIVDLVIGANACVIEGKKIEIIGTGIVHLIFRVVIFEPQRTAPFSKIQGQAIPYRHDISSVRLENVPVNLRPRFVCRIPLQGIRRLAELQVQAGTESTPLRDIRSTLEDDT